MLGRVVGVTADDAGRLLEAHAAEVLSSNDSTPTKLHHDEVVVVDPNRGRSNARRCKPESEGVHHDLRIASADLSELPDRPLRAGLATAAAGVQERVIAQTTGHKSMTVLRRSIREGSLFNESAAAAVGL